MRRPARALAALLVGTLLAAGCGGDDDEPSGGAAPSTTTTTTTTTTNVAPAPTTTTAPPVAGDLAAGLLTPADLPAGWRPVGDGRGGLVDDPIPAICGEGTVDLSAAAERAEATLTAGALGPFAFHALGRFGGATGATAAFSSFVATIERCAAASGQQITFEPLDLAPRGDQRHGVRLGLVSPIGRVGFDLALTRYDDVLSLLMVGGLAPDPALLDRAAGAVDARL